VPSRLFMRYLQPLFCHELFSLPVCCINVYPVPFSASPSYGGGWVPSLISTLAIALVLVLAICFAVYLWEMRCVSQVERELDELSDKT